MPGHCSAPGVLWELAGAATGPASWRHDWTGKLHLQWFCAFSLISPWDFWKLNLESTWNCIASVPQHTPGYSTAPCYAGRLIPTTTLVQLGSAHELDLVAKWTHTKVDLLCKETSLFPEPAALIASCMFRASKANQIAPQSWYSFSSFSIHNCIPMLHSQHEARVR